VEGTDPIVTKQIAANGPKRPTVVTATATAIVEIGIVITVAVKERESTMVIGVTVATGRAPQNGEHAMEGEMQIGNMAEIVAAILPGKRKRIGRDAMGMISAGESGTLPQTSATRTRNEMLGVPVTGTRAEKRIRVGTTNRDAMAFMALDSSLLRVRNNS
jgi:hypothetical protein